MGAGKNIKLYGTLYTPDFLSKEYIKFRNEGAAEQKGVELRGKNIIFCSTGPAIYE